MIELKQMFRLKAGYFIFLLHQVHTTSKRTNSPGYELHGFKLPSSILPMNIDADDTRIKLLQKQQKSIYHKFNSLNSKVL